MIVFEKILEFKKAGRKAWFVLIDPDNWTQEEIPYFTQKCCESGADGILIGGSTLFNQKFDEFVKNVKTYSSVPVILFPGSPHQLSIYADAILFLSLLSGRNPQYLIGDHVLAAPIVLKMQLETIATGYMLIEGGTETETARVSDTHPISRDATSVVISHALAGKFLGMKSIYLEAGSGANLPVPDAMISAVRETVNLLLIIGGGIKTPKTAREKAEAGADIIVTGNVFEKDSLDVGLMRDFAEAVHFS